MTRRLPILLVLSLAAAGCSSSEGDAATSDEELRGEHFPATHCEVFVDRAAPFFTSHGVSQLTVYLKTPVDKLQGRGGVKSAGYHAQEIANGKPGAFKDIVARRFENASDYWQLTFSMTSDFTPTTSFKGAFYVEAGDGTRLWLNASEGGRDFSLDSNMVGNLSNLRPGGFFATNGNTLPKAAIVAADEFPYLNAQRCR